MTSSLKYAQYLTLQLRRNEALKEYEKVTRELIEFEIENDEELGAYLIEANRKLEALKEE
jgi:hypothetical protein